MSKSSSTSLTQTTSPSKTTIVKDLPDEVAAVVLGFCRDVGFSSSIPASFDYNDSYSDLIRGHLTAATVQRGCSSCILTVAPAISNYFDALHGGAVAAIAERVSIACAKTVVGEDKEIFLGELSMSYLSAAPRNEELIVEGNVVRSGRNLTVTAVEFKLKKTGKLVYTARATFYNMPVSKL